MSQLYKPAILWFVEEMEKTLLLELVGSLKFNFLVQRRLRFVYDSMKGFNGFTPIV